MSFSFDRIGSILPGSADQQHFFRISYGDVDDNGRLPVVVESTYGNGTGYSEVTYEHAVLDIQAEVSETVNLVKRGEENIDVPYIRIEERAGIFVPID